MHCRACDCVLTDFEATRKSSVTGEYYDLCDQNGCFKASGIDDNTVVERLDLLGVKDDSDGDTDC